MASVGTLSGDPERLLGTWQFERTIVDAAAHSTYTVSGSAVLEPVERGIRWHEDGMFRRDGADHPVMRTLFLRPDAIAPGRWHVEFDDGRPFHDWMVDTPVTHRCGADTYRGLVMMIGSDRWSVRWDVEGPQKDYEMTTTYRTPQSGPSDCANVEVGAH
jgi:hypothetical protein